MFAIDGEDLERARSALQEVEDIHSYLRRAEKDISELCELHQQLHAMVHRTPGMILSLVAEVASCSVAV
mgnify:FL=1